MDLIKLSHLFVILMPLYFCSCSLGDNTIEKLNRHLHNTCGGFDASKSMTISGDTLFDNGGIGTRKIPLQTVYFTIDTVNMGNGLLYSIKINCFNHENCLELIKFDTSNAVFKIMADVSGHVYVPGETMFFSNANDMQIAYILLSELQMKAKGQRFDF